MKICYLSASLIPSRYANSVQVMKMCQAFVRNGHEVELYARQPEKALPDVDDYNYYGVDAIFPIVRKRWPPLRGLGGWLYARKVRSEVTKRPLPDLFYGRDIYSLLAVSSLGKPLIYEAHVPPGSIFRKLLEKQLYLRPNFKRHIVISNALYNEYLRLFPQLLHEKVLVYHDGADELESVKANQVWMGLSGRSNAIKVGYVGHLYPGKGMEVIAELSKRLPQVDFHVVGGTENDLARWRKEIQLPNLYFHGFIPHGQLLSYYKAFDILLAPYQERVSGAGGRGDISRWMSPLKIFEYMAYGKAIIVSDLPVLREIIHHGYNGLLCQPNNIEAWENALYALIKDPNLRKELGENARSDFKQRYTWQKRAEAVLV